MYRSSNFSKSSLIARKCSPTSCRTQKLTQKKILHYKNERYMSSASKSDGKNLLYWGASFGTVALLGTSLTVLAKNNIVFRGAVENALPFTKPIFNAFLPTKELAPPEEKDLSIVITEEHRDEGEEFSPSPSPEDVAVVNIMDTPGISQIDFEVGSKHLPLEELEDKESGFELNVSEDVTISGAALSTDNEYSDNSVLPIQEEDVDVPLEDKPLTKEEVESLAELVNKDSLEIVLSNSCDILEVVLKDALSSQSNAAGLLHSYVTQYGLSLLVPKSDPAYNSIWDATSELEHRVQENIDAAKAKESEINSHIRSIQDLIPTIHGSGSSEIVDRAELLIAGCHDHLVHGEAEIQLAVNKLNMLLDFQKRLNLSGLTLREYLKDFAPDFIKLLKKEDDLESLSKEDALLLLSLKRPELILAEVEEEKNKQAKKLDEALVKQKEDLSRAAEENLITEIKKAEANKDNEMNLKIEEINKTHEIELHNQVKVLSESHQHRLESAIASQKHQLTAEHLKQMEVKLNDQENIHRNVLEKSLSQLEGIQSKITDIVDLDEQQRRTHQLWVAAQTLNAALESSVVNGRTRSLMPDISTVLQYGGNDEFLESVVASVSETAAMMGVIPESDLLHRFSNVKRACKRVAMVSEEGGSFLSYSLSYIKSFFVISQWYRGYAEGEVDLEKLGPYEILEKADYYVERGDLVQAAKFMSQLKGVPRKMSIDWMKEVRLLLETKQAAKTLLAYATSLVAGFE